MKKALEEDDFTEVSSDTTTLTITLIGVLVLRSKYLSQLSLLPILGPPPPTGTHKHYSARLLPRYPQTGSTAGVHRGLSEQ